MNDFARLVSAAMQLLAHPQVAAKFEDGEDMQCEGMDLVDDTLVVTDFMNDLRNLRVLCHRVVTLLSSIRENATEHYMQTVFTLLNTLSQMLADLHCGSP